MVLVWSISDSRTSLADHVTSGHVYLYLCTEASSVSVLYVGWWKRESRKWKPVPTRSLLFSISTWGPSGLSLHPTDEPLSSVGCSMPSPHLYWGRVCPNECYNIHEVWYTECLKLMYKLFETLFFSNEMRQKYNYCCLWSRRHCKIIATRSPSFLFLNKHDGEIIIRWT